MADRLFQWQRRVSKVILDPRAYFPLLLIAGSAVFVVWVICGVGGFPRIVSIIGIPIAGLLLFIHYEKAFYLLLASLYLPLVVVIGYIPNFQIWEILIPVLFIFTLIRLGVFEEIRVGEKFIPNALKLYLAVGILSYLMHPSLPSLASKTFEEMSGFRAYWGFFIQFALCFSLPFLIGRSKEKLMRVIKFFIILNLLTLLVNFYMVLSGCHIPGITQFSWVVHREEGILAGALAGAGSRFLILILLFNLIGWIKKLKPFFIILGGLAIWVGGGRACLLITLAILFLYAFIQRRYKFMFLSVFAIFFLILLQTAFSPLIDSFPSFLRRAITIMPTDEHYGHRGAIAGTYQRIEIYERGLEKVKEHPFLGNGFMKLKGKRESYVLDQTEIWSGAGTHGGYIGIAVTLGIPALLIFIWCVLTYFRKAYILYRDAEDKFIKTFNLWLLLGCFWYALALIFGGSPFTMQGFFFTLGLINTSWLFYRKKNA